MQLITIQALLTIAQSTIYTANTTNTNFHTPPQVGWWKISSNPNLNNISVCSCFPNAFVNMSASWSLLAIYDVVTSPSCNLSLIKWQSISICFVLSWYMGFEAICKAALLSQCNSIGKSTLAPNSLNKPYNHTNSATVVAMLLYSASAELLDTVCCFFDFQEIRESPYFIPKPVTNFLDNKQDAQSASQYAVTFPEFLLLIRRPSAGCCLIYLITCKAAS